MDRQCLVLTQGVVAIPVSAVLFPLFLAGRADQTWKRSNKSSRKWKVWTYLGSDRVQEVQTVRRRSREDPCVLLQTATGDPGRWDRLVVHRRPTTHKIILINDVVPLRVPGTVRKEPATRRITSAPRLEV